MSFSLPRFWCAVVLVCGYSRKLQKLVNFWRKTWSYLVHLQSRISYRLGGLFDEFVMFYDKRVMDFQDVCFSGI
jgi:hypothetical protein